MRQAQRGGTFLGIIIGVVIGLGLALAVAIYVTKVPVPFMNKNQPRKAEQDAAEALKNKNWDPNAPLYGKNPARPAASAASDAAPAAPAAAGASAAKPARPADTAATPAPTPKPEARAASSADPLGDLAKSRSAAAPAAAATADPFSYFVQAGAFRTPEDAEAQRAKLGLMGLEAKVTEREQSGRTVFRVRVGPFDNKDAADKTKERLEGAAIESTLVRVQR